MNIIQAIDKRKVKENKIVTFADELLNFKVRTISFDDGSIGINVEDVAKGLGFIQIKNKKEYVRWETLNNYCNEIGFSQQVGKGDYIPESLFYLLGMKASNKIAQDFQRWLAIDVIPQIRITGGYIPTNEEDDETTIMAKALMIAQKTINKKDELLKAKTKELEIYIEETKPKVKYADEILLSDGAMLVTNIAADYGMSARTLNKILAEERIQRKSRGQWILYKNYMGHGYTKSETEMHGGKARSQTLWTQKGRMLIHEVLSHRGIRALVDLDNSQWA